MTDWCNTSISHANNMVSQALLAMGSQVQECASSMEAMRSDVRKGTYLNPMAMSQTLPALQQKTYLQVKGKQCRNEDGKCCVIIKPNSGQSVFEV